MAKVLVINTAWCKGCGICAAFCPKGALKIEHEKVTLANESACVLCGFCEQHCPDYAIFIKEIKETEGKE